MKKSLISLTALSVVLFVAYNAFAATQFTASSVFYYTDGTCPFPCAANPERHWRADFPGANCNGEGSPTYSGTVIDDGNWWDHNTWQLTKTWMAWNGCINFNPCYGCTQTTQSCARTNFKAWCAY